jgi:23S rRNA pseudouridine2605 synthase
MSEAIRVQKWLAELGVGSRHEAERWIKAGRLALNGSAVQLGEKVDPYAKNHITLDGVPLSTRSAPTKVYWIMHKPDLVLTSRANELDGKRNIYDLPSLKAKEVLVHPVGRLDYRTEGLLLLTNDGDLCYRLSHPRYGMDRRYLVLISGKLTREEEKQLADGIKLEDGVAKCKIEYSTGVDLGGSRGSWYTVIVTEGRNRMVRRMFERIEHPVVKLVRYGFGPIMLPNDLRPGEIRPLQPSQVNQLREAVGFVNRS